MYTLLDNAASAFANSTSVDGIGAVAAADPMNCVVAAEVTVDAFVAFEAIEAAEAAAAADAAAQAAFEAQVVADMQAAAAAAGQNVAEQDVDLFAAMMGM